MCIISVLCHNTKTLTIRGTAEKDNLSYGTDIRVEKILLNG